MIPVPKPEPRPKKERRPMRRTGRIKATGGRLFSGREDPEYLTYLRAGPCDVCAALHVQQTAPTEVEHFVTKSHGGYDRGDTYRTCGVHREMRHVQMGTRGFTRYLLAHGLDERVLCNTLATTYETERWPCP